ncbi:alpha/beta fold hydrolase [Lacihabitans soyangensis]|uniref:Alpha/beta fold hydrolase n=1 Tax=Lacihabitans soyangensis TaxID=869394 RepID=A0AAE3H7I5_9BACT|nr:alpha/beta fold hydrolase [Lacihabitans soyangensis]MCP9765605.1 alpha/beta fold hydrolase [Lacihabitans soyangensis]
MNNLTFKLILLLGTSAIAQNKLFVPPLPEMSYVSVVDKSKFVGDRWSFMESGAKDAPVIIAMHGYGGSSADWRYQLHDLSDTYRVIAWNAPGYMLSDELKTDYPTCKDYADALADFCNALKLDKVHLLGNSFGSRVSQCFAYHYPERVIKMAFVGPSAGKKNISYEERERYVNMRYDQIKDGAFAFTNKRVEALLAPNTSPELIEIARQGMRGVSPRMFMRGTNFMMAEDHFPEKIATKATMPTLVIAGTEDKVSPITTNAEPISKAFPNVKLEILKGIGHLPHLEAYQQVNKMVREFFGANAKAKSNQKAFTDYEKNVYRQIDSLIQYQEQLVLKQDTLAMRAFYPDDMVITNPFGQMINKETTIARVKSGIIKYSKFEKIIEHFAMEGSKTAIVAGLEKVTPTPDANRADAGKPHERRFTEIWVYRDGRWQRLIRHASNI